MTRFWFRKSRKNGHIARVHEDEALRHIVEKQFESMEEARSVVTSKKPMKTDYSFWWPDNRAEVVQ